MIIILAMLLSYVIDQSDSDAINNNTEVHNPNQANPWTEE
jgi:hypothetical protein